MRSFAQGGRVSSDFPSKLIIRPEMLDDSVVFHCSGRLTLEYSAELKDAVTAVMPHKRSVTIELGEVSHMDSSGDRGALRIREAGKLRISTAELQSRHPQTIRAFESALAF
jgi:anti-anti-sigma regulatory factor